MTSNALRFKWSSILVASVTVWVLGFVLVAMVVFAYAFSLGWAARGAPDTDVIQQFANRVGPVWTPRLCVLLTGIAAIWLGRRVIARPIWHGVLIGIIVATPLVMRRRFGIEPVLLFSVTLLAGAVGGWLGSQIKGSRPNSGDPQHAV
jgi:hypothetical protein